MKDKYTLSRTSKGERYYSQIRKMKKINQQFKLRKMRTFTVEINRSDDRLSALSPGPVVEEKSMEFSPRSPMNYRRSEKNISAFSPRYETSSDHEEVPAWDKLTFADKAKLFSYWVPVIMLANLLIIIGCVFMLFNTKEIHHKGEIILGLGGMLTWVTLLKYYEATRGYNIVLTTFQNSYSIAFKAMIGIMPVFIGFGILGMCIFWKSKRFMGLGASMFSLFSLMNGDMIFDAYHDLDTIDFILSQVYLYSFIMLSIMVIHNVFIVIIEDGYMIAKFRDRNDWLKTNKNKEQPIPTVHDHHLLFLQGTEFQNQITTPKKQKKEVTQDNPFAKFSRKRKRDEKSREALVKMLWYDKFSHNQEHNHFRDREGSKEQISQNNRFSTMSLSPKSRIRSQFEPSFNVLLSDAAVSKMDELCKATILSYQNELSSTFMQGNDTDEVKARYMEAVDKMKLLLNEMETQIKDN